MKQAMHAALWAAGLVLLMSLPPSAQAQMDLSGEWAPLFHEDRPERLAGPSLGDYLGLPINDAGRLRSETWDAALLGLPEHQCKPHPADYSPRGPANIRIWKEVDTASQELTAYRTHISWMAPERTIFMDGRPHPPPYAPHTWQGFSTGVWDGNKLVVTTTHLKAGWVRRNGVPRSDQATLREHFIRHGNYLTLVSVIEDPAYLSEPFVRTTNWRLDLTQRIAPYPCTPVVEVERPEGSVPHHLPGQNPFLSEFPASVGISPDLAGGGAATMYPEIMTPDAGNADDRAPRARPAAIPDGQIHVWPVQGNVYLLSGPSANSAVQIGGQGVLAVDTGTQITSGAVLEAIQSLTDRPIQYVINTHAHADHSGGNAAIAQAGRTITGGNVLGAISDAGEGAAVVAHEQVLFQMMDPGDGREPAAFEALPTETYYGDGLDKFFNGEGIRILHQPSAHTGADSMVYFRRSDVLVTGDVFSMDRYPVIDLEHGGSINGIVDGLNRIIDLTIPQEKQEGGTMVIPGHGRVADEADVVDYRDMVTVLRDRVQSMIDREMTLAQVLQARPTRDYDPLYGSESGEWTTDMFVRAVFESLTAERE